MKWDFGHGRSNIVADIILIKNWLIEDAFNFFLAKNGFVEMKRNALKKVSKYFFLVNSISNNQFWSPQFWITQVHFCNNSSSFSSETCSCGWSCGWSSLSFQTSNLISCRAKTSWSKSLIFFHLVIKSYFFYYYKIFKEGNLLGLNNDE